MTTQIIELPEEEKDEVIEMKPHWGMSTKEIKELSKKDKKLSKKWKPNH